MISKWKLQRELARLRTQVAAIPALISQPFVQWRYDKRRAEIVKIKPGGVPCGENVVIYLIFQPNGVSESVLETCKYLNNSGFSPIVISNCELSSHDESAIATNAHLVVQRPNYGYDFGGYRDGVWLLNARGIAPKALVFLNDSVWFPAVKNTNMLSRLIDSPDDYVGTQVFGDISKIGKRRGFFGSYCFCIKSPVWKSDEFQSFWKNYQNISNKEVTLRRGERAFSRLMLSVFGGSCLYSQGQFESLIATLTPAELKQAVQDMVVTDPNLEAKRSAITKQGLDKVAEKEMKALILASARSKNYIAAAPILCVAKLGFPMIKKNKERHYILARKRILQAVDEGRLTNISSLVVNEMRDKNHANSLGLTCNFKTKRA